MKTPQSHTDRLDIGALPERLSHTRGQQFWRSLDELVDSNSFRELLHREFPRGASELLDQVSRRTFLKLMGASLALAGLVGCGASPRQPQEKIAPFARAPLEYMPGQALYYATALALGGYATGVLVESHDGRPTKIEGNPNHPASLGSTDIFAQAEILALYDPDRSQIVLRQGTINTWENFLTELRERMEVQRALQGVGLRVLSGPITSPTLAAQRQQLLERFPQARWYQYDPISRDNVRAGANLAFGEIVEPVYRFDQAAVIVSLEADFLFSSPGHVRYARDFANGRRVRANQTAMNRLYVLESTPSITGTNADHRLRLRSSEVEAAVRFIARELGLDVPQAEAVPDQEWLAALVRDLQDNQGRSLVLAGESQPPIVHALAHAINERLGNVGTTVNYIPPVEVEPSNQIDDLRQLSIEMESQLVDVLVILAENPAFTAPADLGFAQAMSKVGFTIELSLYNDETAALSTWHIPAAHSLEMWSDLRAFDGTASIVQPLIAPLYAGRSPHELIAAVLGDTVTPNYDLVRGYWQEQIAEADFETTWGVALNNGLLADTAAAPRQVALQSDFLAQPPTPALTGLELVFRPDPTIWDGHYANNGWLQELPKPGTLLTWDNAALISPRTAISLLNLAVSDPNALAVADLEQLRLNNGRMVELRYQGKTLKVPIWITPGQADDVVTLYLGYGHTQMGQVGVGTGFNAYALRSSASLWFDGGLELGVTSDYYPLVTTQDHHAMEGRDLVRAGTVEEFRADPKSIFKEVYKEKYGEEQKPDYQSLLPEFAYLENAWGMSIDLTTCIGCNACVIACQAENNIPVVGKEEVGRGREMHWIRVDRYYAGANLDNPASYVQPVTCMQCEKAPCELVCPVNATVHDSEGINNMVYNRCVGTKYCSNNCPYKVRRFNFFQYADLQTESIKLMQNPDVSVRNRGVMEKCTYCVQRISAARITAKKEGRSIADGEVLTACQQVCPTQAIVFGDIKNGQSQVAQLKSEPLNYTLLDELNVQPRTSYLARLRNLNPAIEALEQG